MIKIQRSETGKFTVVPKGIVITNVYGNIEITRKQQNREIHKSNINECLELKMGDNYVENLGVNIRIKQVSNNKSMNFKGKENVKYFNCDNVKNISVRVRKDGDRFVPFGMKGSKKLKDIFMDLKVPRDKRDFVPLICFDEEISWIVGYKISDKFKIHEGVKNIIEVTVERQEKNE